MIYLDNAATTVLLPEVIEKMTEVMTSTYGNPSSIHTLGRKANQVLREQRENVAQLLGTKADRIIFTSGGTESNNTALKGYALANQSKGKHIISTSIEHHSVLHTLSFLEKECGFEVTYLNPVNKTISVQQVQEALREDTILVSIMFANNETGSIHPIQEIGHLLKQHQAAFHVDAVQVAGKLPLLPEQLGIDFLSISAHKFHGPKGVGLLYAAPLQFHNLLHGGDQEQKRRASTENLAGIVGMVTALQLAHDHMTEHFKAAEQLRSALLTQLDPIDYYLNDSKNNLPHVVNIGFSGYHNSILLTQLDLAGFCVSTGSACTAGTVEPSHVLEAFYGQGTPPLQESIRISFSHLNTIDEITLFAEKIKEIIGK